jgi:hypothetical protein
LVLAELSVNNLNNKKKKINIKKIFCVFINLIFVNNKILNKSNNPIYKVKLGLRKHINKKRIVADMFINLLKLEINNK